MSAYHPGAAWLADLLARTDQPPTRPREALCVPGPAGSEPGGVRVGSLERALATLLHAQGLLQQHHVPHAGHPAWLVPGEPVAGLNRIADHLRRAGLAGAWRDEQLAVTDDHGRVLATVERAAVRPLGIRTRAVHLVGLAADGRMWVQQRAWTKANDPGLWDTLMGGMIGAHDTLAGALERETWEEAGLRPGELSAVEHGGHVLMRADSGAGSGAMGYTEERIDWYRALVPPGVTPRNQDGEVERFELLDIPALVERLRAGAFTPEAARVIAACLGWSGAVTPAPLG